MTAEGIERAITADTTVILVTHQFGIPPDMDEIGEVCARYGTLVVEDAAAAFGATFGGRLVGTFGRAAILSFHRTKVVSADLGGALITNDDQLAQRVEDLCRSELLPSAFWKPFLRSAAWKAVMSPALYAGVRLAYRLAYGEQMVQLVRARASCPARFFRDCSPLSAALLSVQLDRLAGQVDQRRRLAEVYRTQLEGTCVRVPTVPAGAAPAWIQMPVRVRDKGKFYHHMLASGVDLSWNFRYSCAESYGQLGCTEARRAAETVLGLPTYPTLSDAQLAAVCRGLRSFVSHHGRDSWQSQSERRVGDCVDSR
jgi:dTDP-4-amino-4,6-dideoxygalactose transaminase